MAQDPNGKDHAVALTHSATIRETTSAPADRVWAIIADGWTYGAWVVGASRVRSVDEAWPAVGATLHHSVGVWPLVRDDVTSVLEVESGRRLLLAARVHPVGTQAVELTITPSGEGSIVTMREEVTHGPLRLVPRRLRQVGLTLRNREAVRRLCLLAARSPDDAREGR
ncbi:SRPBCC family protein [Janibacter sp. GS2]|uniref:SRPBCC family protein n=1 Tax=Janibacter sp. GS2 TaxID=3442646 RepID=UPI003EBC1726